MFSTFIDVLQEELANIWAHFAFSISISLFQFHPRFPVSIFFQLISLKNLFCSLFTHTFTGKFSCYSLSQCTKETHLKSSSRREFTTTRYSATLFSLFLIKVPPRLASFTSCKPHPNLSLSLFQAHSWTRKNWWSLTCWPPHPHFSFHFLICSSSLIFTRSHVIAKAVCQQHVSRKLSQVRVDNKKMLHLTTLTKTKRPHWRSFTDTLLPVVSKKWKAHA